MSMKFAGLGEMEKLQEELNKLTLYRFGLSSLFDAEIRMIDSQATLISKLCHACDKLETQIDRLDSISANHKDRITELEAWRERMTGDGR